MVSAMAAFRAASIEAETWRASGRPPLLPRLARHPAVRLRGALGVRESRDLVARVRAARGDWTADFGGEQFALGRAFYTHLETGKSKEYFSGAAASDALVESVLPGLAGRTLALFAELLGG